MNKIYDLILKFLFIVGFYTKKIKNDKQYTFEYDDVTKQNIINAFKSKNLLIVSNHMTLADSTIIQLFIIKIFGWFGVIKNNFRQIIWNLPAIENLKLLRNNTTDVNMFLYSKISRIIPIDRSNQDSSMKTLEKVSNLILKRNVFLIFPEAGRTRRNEFSVEDMTPGAAKILLDCQKQSGNIPGLLVLYVRADNQIGHSNIPTSDKIKIYADFVNQFPIQDNESQLRKRKNLTTFIGDKINLLQNRYNKTIF